MVAIDDFSKGLAAIREEEFTHSNVLDYLRKNIVEPATLAPYLFICGEHYTRNLILKTPLFELIAICWDIGQKSPIHNHRDQNCWMAMAYGRLQVHNFSLVKKDCSTQFCELQSADRFVLDPEHPTEVNPTEPIHRVNNLPTYNSRAVSLHVYSKPFDTCEVYDLKEKRYQDVPLINTTEYGKVMPTEWKVEKFSL